MPLVYASPAFIHFQWSRRKSGPQTNLQCGGRSGAFPGWLRLSKKGQFMPFGLIRRHNNVAPVAPGLDPGAAQRPFVVPASGNGGHQINHHVVVNVAIPAQRQTQGAAKTRRLTTVVPAEPHQQPQVHVTPHARTQPKPQRKLKPGPTAHGAPLPARDPHGPIHTLSPLQDFTLR
jgi:hypothetical protein